MLRVLNCRVVFRGLVLAGLGVLASMHVSAQQIGPAVLQQIAAISAAKANFTAAQKKLDSRLAFTAMVARNGLGTDTLKGVVPNLGTSDAITVDIKGKVTPSLLSAITAAGGRIIDQSAKWNLIRASLPLGAAESVGGHPDVVNVRTAARARLNGMSVPFRRTPLRVGPASIWSQTGVDFVGALTSQGYISHAANLVVKNQGITGAGVTVGVLSDSASAAGIAALIASGDLPPGTHSLPGQDGAPGTDEGTAMMEIVQDIAPGANLIFATAFEGEASFASNILALQAAGARVIVDDVTYFDEGAFQDGLVAQAVSQVTANGAIYFSSAANSGNLTLGTSGTWEGDYRADGVIAGVGTLHNFGTVASPQDYDQLTAVSDFISLKWSDPLGASVNDYDLYILNAAGTVLKGFSAGAQTGAEDPFEFIFQGHNCGTSAAAGYCPAAGDRVLVVLFSGAQRALRIDTNQGQLSIRTAGSTYGHNAGIDTVSTAASYWNSGKTGTRPFTGLANPIEPFSSDCQRKIESS